MPRITVATENDAPIEIHYEDHGAGQPVVLIHGYPLSGRAWDRQVPVLLEAGHRVITYDRRGFGQSSQPVVGYDYDTLRGTLVSDQAYQASWNIAASASATAAVACIPTWATDFRADLPKVDVPILVVQGDADQVLPLDKTGKRLPGLIDDVQLVVIEGGPHAIPWTHADQVNTALLDFLRSYDRHDTSIQTQTVTT